MLNIKITRCKICQEFLFCVDIGTLHAIFYSVRQQIRFFLKIPHSDHKCNKKNMKNFNKFDISEFLLIDFANDARGIGGFAFE